MAYNKALIVSEQTLIASEQTLIASDQALIASDQALISLFHSMPFEIREKIQRFTYKTQSRELLAEILDFVSAKAYVQEFTHIVDISNSSLNFNETIESIHDHLWSGLDFIRRKPYKTRLIQTWKYKDEFKGAESAHVNGKKHYKLLELEMSFAVYFWMCVYH